MDHEQDGPRSHDAHTLQHTHLFTLRLWEEQLGDGEAEWRGRVQIIASGDTHYFRGWPGLIALLSRLTAEDQGPTPGSQDAPAVN